MKDNYKILLDESEMPTQWYNIVADLPEPPPPPLHPGTHEPATAEDFGPLFPQALIEQEMSTERYIDIPGDVLMFIGCGAPALVSCAPLEKVARYAGKDLLQVRRREPRRSRINRIPRCRKFGTTPKRVSAS